MNVLKIKTIHKAEKPKTIHSSKWQKLEKKNENSGEKRWNSIVKQKKVMSTVGSK